MFDIEKFNQEITAFVGPDEVGDDGEGTARLPHLRLPNGAEVYAYIHPPTERSGEKPYLQVSVHLDGDGWDHALTLASADVRMQVTVEATDVFTAFHPEIKPPVGRRTLWWADLKVGKHVEFIRNGELHQGIVDEVKPSVVSVWVKDKEQKPGGGFWHGFRIHDVAAEQLWVPFRTKKEN